MEYLKIKELIQKEIAKNHDELFRMNCHIADNPEISSEEANSSRTLVELLTSHGFKCEYPLGKFD